MKVLVEGVQRARINEFTEKSEYVEVEVIRIDENIKVTADVKALMRSIETTFEQYVKLNQKIPWSRYLPLPTSRNRISLQTPSLRILPLPRRTSRISSTPTIRRID